MDLRKLEIFVQVVSEGSFSKASRTLFLSQPTVSAHMDSLEKELGTLLFERRNRGIVLTRAGRKLLPYALDLLNLKKQALKAMHRYGHTVEGDITIAASSTPGTYLLPNLLKVFRSCYPQVSFSVELASSHGVMEKVLGYEVDMGLIGTAPNVDSVSSVPIMEDELLLLIPPHEQYSVLKDTVTLKEISSHPLILRRPGSATRETFIQALEKRSWSLGQLQIPIQMDNLEGVISCVRQGLGISVASSLSLAQDDVIRQARIQELDLKRMFYLIYNEQRVFSPAAERFLNCVKTGGEKNETHISG